jgi:hypothetical protein
MSPCANHRMVRPALLRPDRLRTIDRPFGWIPCRLLTDGLLEQLGRPAKLLYLLLALAADRQGISFYGDQKIQRTLDLSTNEMEQARAQLIHHDLLAFDGHTYQLLSLPCRFSTHGYEQPEASGPSTSCPPIRPEKPCIANQEPAQIPEEARRQLSAILGRDFF